MLPLFFLLYLCNMLISEFVIKAFVAISAFLVILYLLLIVVVALLFFTAVAYTLLKELAPKTYHYIRKKLLRY